MKKIEKYILYGIAILLFALGIYIGTLQQKPTVTTPPVIVQSADATKEINVFQKAQKGVPFRWAHGNQKHPVTRIMIAGFLKGCEDYGVLCENMSVADDNAVLTLMEQSITMGSTGQIFPIYLPEHYQQALDMIKKGVPVIGTHFPVDIKNVPGLLAWVAPDNVGYAIQTGKAMGEKLQCKGTVGITQSSLNDGENAVADNFKKSLLATCPNIKVLDVQVEGFDIPKAILVASAIIQANPDITGAFSTTGNGPTTWASAAKENGKKPGEITIISMDYTTPNLDLVKSGEVYMLVGQPLFEEFYYAVGVFVSNLMGYPVPYENTLPAPLITKDNVDKYYAINKLAEGVPIK
jgi:ribose transport system substrate-binding protein